MQEQLNTQQSCQRIGLKDEKKLLFQREHNLHFETSSQYYKQVLKQLMKDKSVSDYWSVQLV